MRLGRDLRALAPAAFDAQHAELAGLCGRFRKALDRFLNPSGTAQTKRKACHFSGKWTVRERQRFDELRTERTPHTVAEWQALADELGTGRSSEIGYKHRSAIHAPSTPFRFSCVAPSTRYAPLRAVRARRFRPR